MSSDSSGEEYSSFGSDTEKDPKKQRISTPGKKSAACFRCTRRKQKCDLKRPTCGRCKDCGSDCEYSSGSKPRIVRPADWSCPILGCFQKFSSRDALRKHCQRKHPNVTTVPLLDVAKQVRIGLKAVEGIDDSLRLQARHRAKRDLRTRLCDTDYFWPCMTPGCLKIFLSRPSLMNHRRTAQHLELPPDEPIEKGKPHPLAEIVSPQLMTLSNDDPRPTPLLRPPMRPHFISNHVMEYHLPPVMTIPGPPSIMPPQSRKRSKRLVAASSVAPKPLLPLAAQAPSAPPGYLPMPPSGRFGVLPSATISFSTPSLPSAAPQISFSTASPSSSSTISSSSSSAAAYSNTPFSPIYSTPIDASMMAFQSPTASPLPHFMHLQQQQQYHHHHQQQQQQQPVMYNLPMTTMPPDDFLLPQPIPWNWGEIESMTDFEAPIYLPQPVPEEQSFNSPALKHIDHEDLHLDLLEDHFDKPMEDSFDYWAAPSFI